MLFRFLIFVVCFYTLYIFGGCCTSQFTSRTKLYEVEDVDEDAAEEDGLSKRRHLVPASSVIALPTAEKPASFTRGDRYVWVTSLMSIITFILNSLSVRCLVNVIINNDMRPCTRSPFFSLACSSLLYFLVCLHSFQALHRSMLPLPIRHRSEMVNIVFVLMMTRMRRGDR